MSFSASYWLPTRWLTTRRTWSSSCRKSRPWRGRHCSAFSLRSPSPILTAISGRCAEFEGCGGGRGRGGEERRGRKDRIVSRVVSRSAFRRWSINFFALLSSFSGVLYVCTTAVLLVLSRCARYGMRDDIPQLVILPFPWRAGMAVHVLFCLFFFHRDAFCNLFCDNGLDFRKMS